MFGILENQLEPGFLIFTSLRPQRGTKNPKKSGALRAPNCCFPWGFPAFCSKGGVKIVKDPARFARRNVDFLRVFKHFCPEMGTPKSRKKGRASRAGFRWPRGPAGHARRRFGPEQVQKCLFFHQSTWPGARINKFVYSFINLARGHR